MKKFLVFILLMCYFVSQAQSEMQTVNNANFPVALYSGIPDINIPLFTVNTTNKDFTLNVKLENNLYACTSKDLSTRGIGDGWSLNILGSITIKPKLITGPISYHAYDETEYTRHLINGIDKESNATYTYSVFGLTGKFVIKKENTTFTLKVLEQNEYADVSMNHTVSGNRFTLNSFTVTDKTGFRYVFSNSDKVAESDPLGGLVAEKRTFYLSAVIDKFNKEILQYNYSGNNPIMPLQRGKYNCELTSISVLNHGIINLSGPNATKRTITYNDLSSNQIQKAEFYFESVIPFNKLQVNRVRIYNTSNANYNIYKISYKSYNEINPDKTIFGFPHVQCVSSDKLNNENTRYDHGAVEKIVTPEGAVTFYEYEPNTASTTVTEEELSQMNPDGQVYKVRMNFIRNSIVGNYTYEPIALNFNSSYSGYLIDLGNYVPFTSDNEQFVYVEYSANEVTIAAPSPSFPDGKYHTPLLGVDKYTTNPLVGSGNVWINNIGCPPGQRFLKTQADEKFYLKIQPEFLSYYNYIRASYKKPKSDNELNYFFYTVGPRIKRIKSFYKEVNSINSTDYIGSEQLFEYKLSGYSRSSSGYSSAFYDGSFYGEEFGDYQDLTLYRNVSVETPGIGKVHYEFEKTGYAFNFSRSMVAKLYKSIKKYNEQNQLTESIDFERDFLETSGQEQFGRAATQPILKYEKAVSESFENGALQGYKTITESTFDTLTRNLTHRKITDAETQTFEEQYTYQKLGNAYYQTQVEKFKNSIPLNRSVFEYGPYGVTAAYNLLRTKVAKSNLPLEIEKEITRYDAHGNITEYKTKEGMLVSQIWGYNNTKLVAELRNVSATVLNLATYLIVRNNIANYSNQSSSDYNEANLTTALNSLRTSFPNGFVTTYTYKPLVGISTITDVNGRKETYQYDSFNRLYRVLNHEGLVTKEYNYNIKN